MRIAMWSGPRNLSTAMMYAFGNRPDFAVWDEPFYAPYLSASGSNHPMRDEIIAVHEVDPSCVGKACLDTIPAEKPHFYMKHMPHHMLPDFPLDWATSCLNIHLIRHPARVVASYGAKRDQVTDADLGFARQVEIHEKLGGLIIDSADIRADPQRFLTRLCADIDLPFDSRMLQWPAGGRAEDGVWARHWYGAVHASTGFAGPEAPLPKLHGHAADLVTRALPHYERLHKNRLH